MTIENYMKMNRDLKDKFIRNFQLRIPKYVSDFIVSYLEDISSTSFLDMWTRKESIIEPICEKLNPDEVIRLCPNRDEYEALSLIGKQEGIDLRFGSVECLLDEIKENFDLIVGHPPFGLRLDSFDFEITDERFSIKGEKGHLLLLKAATLLKENGTGIFIVTDNFFNSTDKNSVYSSLAKFDLYVEAAISLPSGTFAPLTQIPSVLVFISRKKQNKLFIGELSSDIKQNNVLLKNLELKENGKKPQLGVLVDHTSYETFNKYILQIEINDLTKRYNTNPYEISKIANVNMENKKLEDGFKDIPNSVYLPIIGKSDVVTSVSNFNMKPQNYIQLVLKPEIANDIYVANFLNTEFGLKIRESLSSYTVIPRITKYKLVHSNLYLPDINSQMKMVEIQSDINNLYAQLDKYEHELWAYPKKAESIEKSIEFLNRDDAFEAWLESLPFPLASILWTYYADSDQEHKIKHLFHFFEALSEFTVMILLSSLKSNNDFYERNKQKFVEDETKEQLTQASFGTWNYLGEKLAKTTRVLLDDEKTRQECMKVFGNPDRNFLDMVTGKKLYSLLKRVNVYRNKWKGHDAYYSKEAISNQLILLENQLSDARKLIGWKYENLVLMIPGKNEYEDGVYEYTVKSLMGTRTKFMELTKETTKPMDKKKLYIIHGSQTEPIEMLPFIRIMPGPKNEADACYYYSRIEASEVRWVSYHYDKDSDFNEPFPEMEKILSLLGNENN